MKTAESAFAGFPRDRYTTLADTDDRIMATKVTATWRYGADVSGLDHDAAFERVLATFMRTFAEHTSLSVQQSIWIIGRAILEAEPAIDEIRFALPNLHHWLADLKPFGMDERPRDLRRDDRAARPHRGDRPPLDLTATSSWPSRATAADGRASQGVCAPYS